MTLAGRTYVVTGTSRGIGQGIAASILARGGRVVGVTRSGPPPGADPERVAHVAADLAALDAPAVIEQAARAFGRLDGLVNNAGLHLTASCWEHSDAELDAILAVNLTAPFLLSQAIARRWVERGEPGVIVNVASIETEIAWLVPPQSGYAVSKGGLLGLTRSMALDLASHGIRVVAVGPGAIDTGMSPPDPGYRDRIPLGQRPGETREVGDAVAFLLSDGASYMTGEIVHVDGGYRLA